MAEESWILEQTRLTANRDWDRTRASAGTGLRSRLVRRWFEETGGSYLGHLVYRVHCEKHLPSGALRVLEIGSAPGHELLAVHRLFGYQPYGVDYNASGVALNRELFVQAGLDPEQVMHQDCFDAGFQARFRSYFDVVMSHGFVEHFANPAEVLEAHARLLKPGGLLLVTVPNLRGLNYLLARLLSPHALETHNLAVMDRKTLVAGLPADEFCVLECRYLGNFGFGLVFGTKKSRVKQLVANLLMNLQWAIDLVVFFLFRGRSLSLPLTSPRLLLLCRKADA